MPRRDISRSGEASAVPNRAPARQVVSWSEAQWLHALVPVLEELGLDLDERQQRLCAAYMGLLSHWNATYNLTAVRDAPEMFTHHLSDCLAVLPPLARHLAAPPQRSQVREGEGAGRPVRLLDVGSGGGLPGVLLAIARPDTHVCCVDTVGKKAAFIRQVAAELKLPNLRAEHARVEEMRSQHDLVTSRAFASLVDFVTWTRNRLAPGGVWMAMKGRAPDDELRELPSDIEVFHVEPLVVPGLDAERCLVWMRPKAG